MKALLSVLKVYCVAASKTFWKSIFALAPALIAYGPCGTGAPQKPYRAARYSPPSGLETVTMARVSPTSDGEKTTSIDASVPPASSAASALHEPAISKFAVLSTEH